MRIHTVKAIPLVRRMAGVAALASGVGLTLHRVAVADPNAGVRGAAKPVQSLIPAVPPYSDWPAPPNGGRPMSYPVGPEYKYKIRPHLEGPMLGLPPNDFIDSVPANPPIRGLLIYTISCGIKYKPWNEYLVFRGIGVRGQWKGQSSQTAHYHFTPYESYRDPVLSSRGQNLLFRSGYTDPYSNFALYHLNVLSGDFNEVGIANNLSRTAFSTDGPLWGLLFNQDDSYPMQSLYTAWKDIGPALLDVRETQRYIPYNADKVPAQKYPYWQVTTAAARRSIVWASNGKLLYTHEPQADFLKTDGQMTTPAAFPSIWIAAPSTKQTHQLIERGYDPSPSPDGRWIAYFGWSPTEHPTPATPASEPRLYLHEMQSGHNYEISDQNSGFVLWTPDSKRLVQVRVLTEKNNETHIGVITLVDALQGPHPPATTNHEVATLAPHNVVQGGADNLPPQEIEVQGVSRNGKYVVLDVTTFTDVAPQQDVFSQEKTLSAVDLQTEMVTTIAHARPPDPHHPITWSWYDESDAPGPQAAK